MRRIQRGSTDQSVVIRIIDETTGIPETGVVWNTAGIDLWYRREGATKTSITEATLATLDAAHSDGGFLHIGDGYYRLDLPDAAWTSTAGVNGVMVGGAVTGMIVIGCYIELTAYNPYDTVRAGLTALPNAAADAVGGLPISDAGGLDLDAKLAATNEVTAARMGALTDWIDAGRLDALLDAVKAKTDNLPTDPADESLLEAAITAAHSTTNGKIDTVDDFIDTEVAAILAAVDTEVGAIKTKTDNLPTDPADESLLIAATDAIMSRLGAPAGASVSADVAAVKVDTAAVKAKTDNLPSDPADESLIIAATDAIKADTAAILTDTGTDGVVLKAAGLASDAVDEIAAAILTTPANKLATDASGRVTEVSVDGVQKNTALANFEFLMVDETDGKTAETGLSVTATRSIDGAAFAACANAVSEVGYGMYKISLAATDLNGDVITLRFTATGALDRFITIKTNA